MPLMLSFFLYITTGSNPGPLSERCLQGYWKFPLLILLEAAALYPPGCSIGTCGDVPLRTYTLTHSQSDDASYATIIVQEHHESRGNFVMKASHHARCLKGTLMVHKKHDGTLGNGAVIYF